MDQLKEIALPQAVSWMPQTSGWYILGAILLVAAAWAIARYVRHRRLNRYRVEALAELERIRKASALVELPALVKRVALQITPRKRIASLTGEPWLAFLDKSYGGTGFSQGPGKMLPVIAYQSPSAITNEQAQSLFDLIADWIRKHHARV